MRVKALKEFLKDIPDNVVITITAMDDHFDWDFGFRDYEDGDTYAELILPLYIDKYTVDASYLEGLNYKEQCAGKTYEEELYEAKEC